MKKINFISLVYVMNLKKLNPEFNILWIFFKEKSTARMFVFCIFELGLEMSMKKIIHVIASNMHILCII